MDRSELELLNAYWRAANYLSVGQTYLLDNPLLRRPLEPADVKARLLGHRGTTSGLNFIYAHMNRVIRCHDLNALYVAGPGHGGPGVVANTYLEGTYSERWPIASTPFAFRRNARIGSPSSGSPGGGRSAAAAISSAASTSRGLRLLEPLFATRMRMSRATGNVDGARHWPDGPAAARTDTHSMTSTGAEARAQG